MRLGVYHTSGYHASAARWDSQVLAPALRDLPVQLYHNYRLGLAPGSSLQALCDALAARGMAFVHQPTPDRIEANAYDLSGFPGFEGVCLADERPIEALPTITEYARRWEAVSANPTSGVFLPGQIRRSGLQWAPVFDALGTDVYPLRVDETQSLPLATVAEATERVVATVEGRKPCVVVLPFFAADGFRWPTEEELRAMTWLAICAGADDLYYWSLGAKGLAWITDLVERERLFQMLRTILYEVAAERAVLDTPRLAVPLEHQVPTSWQRAHRDGDTLALYACERALPHALTIARVPWRVQVRVTSTSTGPVTPSPEILVEGDADLTVVTAVVPPLPAPIPTLPPTAPPPTPAPGITRFAENPIVSGGVTSPSIVERGDGARIIYSSQHTGTAIDALVFPDGNLHGAPLPIPDVLRLEHLWAVFGNPPGTGQQVLHAADPHWVGDRVRLYASAQLRAFSPTFASTQKSIVAESADGLTGWTVHPTPWTDSQYARVIQLPNGVWFALCRFGECYVSADGLTDWLPVRVADYCCLYYARADQLAGIGCATPGPRGQGRHSALHLAAPDRLDVYYTRIGDPLDSPAAAAPERVFRFRLTLTDVGDPATWLVGAAQAVVGPEFDYEGVDLPIAVSLSGPSPARVHQLRDPFVFVAGDGAVTLAYAGAGEWTLCLADLVAA